MLRAGIVGSALTLTVIGGAVAWIYATHKTQNANKYINVPTECHDMQILQIKIKKYPILGNVFDKFIGRSVMRHFGITIPDHHWGCVKLSNGTYLCIQKDWTGNLYVTHHATEDEADASTYKNTAWYSQCFKHRTLVRLIDLHYPIQTRKVIEWCKQTGATYDLLINNCQRFVSDLIEWITIMPLFDKINTIL